VSLVPFLAARAVVAGLFVVAFSVIGEVVRPKRFAGIFSAAPSVALANLALIVAVQGTVKATAESRAMIGGGVAMTVACLAGIPAIRRMMAWRGVAAIALVWLAVAAVAAAVLA
jgi:hypothetical protein